MSLLKVLQFPLIFLQMGLALLLVKFLLTHRVWTFFFLFPSASSVLQGIPSLFSNLCTFLGVYLSVHIVAVIFLRIGNNKVVPYKGTQPETILCLNRIIMNTLEHSAVFGCLLFGAMWNNHLKWTYENYVVLIQVFMFGRTLFSVGYFLGELLNLPRLRQPGVILSMTPTISLLIGKLGVDIFQQLSNFTLLGQL